MTVDLQAFWNPKEHCGLIQHGHPWPANEGDNWLLLLESGARCCAWGHPFFITAVIDITTQHFLFLSFFRDWLAHTLPSAASRIFYSICNTSRLICSSKLTRTSYPIWSIRSKQQFGIVWSQHFTAFCPLFFLNSNILQTNMMNKKEN